MGQEAVRGRAEATILLWLEQSTSFPSFQTISPLTIKKAIIVDDDAHRVDDLTRKRNICIAVTVVLLVYVTTLFTLYNRASP